MALTVLRDWGVGFGTTPPPPAFPLGERVAGPSIRLLVIYIYSMTSDTPLFDYQGCSSIRLVIFLYSITSDVRLLVIRFLVTDHRSSNIYLPPHPRRLPRGGVLQVPTPWGSVRLELGLS